MTIKRKSSLTVEQTISQFIDAGIGLVTLPFTIAQNAVSTSKEEVSQQLESLQARGEKVDAKIRSALIPSQLCNKLVNLLPSKSENSLKLDQLSQKVDTLVELVAVIAAKQADEASVKPTPTKKAPTARTRAPRSANKTTKASATKTQVTASMTKKEP